MPVPPPDMHEIMQAIGALHAGDREGARRDLLRLWRQWRDEGSPLQRCTIAHFLADTEAELSAELAWDRRALAAATGADDDRDRDPLDPALASFLPSLHLNVGDAYRRLGDLDRARRHAENGLARSRRLGSDGYGETIKGGLARLAKRIGDER